jgi:hypothetical protein
VWFIRCVCKFVRAGVIWVVRRHPSLTPSRKDQGYDRSPTFGKR